MLLSFTFFRKPISKMGTTGQLNTEQNDLFLRPKIGSPLRTENRQGCPRINVPISIQKA